MQITRDALRNLALSHTLFSPTSLSEAINTLGFIQADPIRSPARAQDLILRLRVNDYHVNDLETHYPELGIEEDFLYAYGFITRELQQYLHPRKRRSLSPLERKILTLATESTSPLDARQLEQLFGRKRVINAWGGHSQAIKMALDTLHYAGYLRISGRDKGRRIYSANKAIVQNESEEERLKKLVLAIVHILYPISERTLNEALSHVRQHIGKTKPIIEALVREGVLERHRVDHLTYFWPVGAMRSITPHEETEVKFLAPFDPLVWDRRRFEHLWGWPYRFEAYTPPSKRVRGYYAMPLLWGDRIVGWTNIGVTKGTMQREHGFVDTPIRDPKFKKELAKEEMRMEAFLNLHKT